MTKTIVDIDVVDVEKRRVPSKHYVYVIVVKWSDESSMVVYRRYSRFFDLQTQLLDKFPIEAGTTDPALRIIPFLPGKIFFGRSNIRDVAMKRLGEIDAYCKSLLALPDHISQCEEVLEFFEVEPEDLDPPKEDPQAKPKQLTMDPLSRKCVMVTRKLSKRLRSSRKQKGEKKVEKISGPKQLERFVAVADYSAQEKGEMNLHANMVVEVTEKSESGWWFVNAEEQQGWVPSTYLQALNGSAAAAQESVEDGHEEKYICIEKFTAENSDEVSLEKGAHVEVLTKNMDGWWTVRYQGTEGFAPATYLKKSTDPHVLDMVEKSRKSGVQIIGNLADVSNLLTTSSASPRNSAILSGSPSNSFVPLPNALANAGSKKAEEERDPADEEGKEEDDVLGEVRGSKRDSMAKVMMKQRSLERGGSLKPPPRANSVQQIVVSPPPPSPSARVSSYITIADFEDTVGDGISFTTGEPVTVLEKTPSGWWFVERGQDQGWVPESYLQQEDSSQTQASSGLDSGDGMEDSEEEEEESEEEEQTQPPSSALASALSSRMKAVNGDQKSSAAWGPPKLPGKPGAKPPPLPSKPQDQGQSEHLLEQSKARGPVSPKEDTPSGIASALKSKFESKPPGLPGKPGEKPALNKPSGPPPPPQKPREKPGPPSLPNKPSGPPVPPSKPGEKPTPPALPGKPAEKPGTPFKQAEKPKPPGLPSKPGEKPGVLGVPQKPERVEGSSSSGGVAGLASSLKSKFESREQEGPAKPVKPLVQTSKPAPPSKSFGGEAPFKPGLPHKPADQGKPALGQKPSPFGKSNASGDTTKPAMPLKGSYSPPKLPSKPQANSKPASDSNNSARGGNRPVSSKVHNLAAVFGRQDGSPSDPKDAQARPSLPIKKPSLPQFPAQKPSNKDSDVPAGKPRVGNLVSELSGKLQFGGGGGGGGGGSSKSPEPFPVPKAAPWSAQTAGSRKTSGPFPAPGLPGQMQNILATPPAAAAPAESVEYEAVADFAAEGEGELCLRCGDLVEVVDQGQEDWWLVRLNKEQGWVPSSYLEPAAQWDD